MELINQTGLAAELLIGDIGTQEESEHQRSGCLLAKATFEAAPRVNLVTDAPLPIFHQPVETAVGHLPPDVRGRRGGPVEFVVLGYARSPAGHPVDSISVSLELGPMRSSLVVTGDRAWIDDGGTVVPGPPAPFTAIPLTWERAFGGTVEAWLDAESSVPLQHRFNARGTGVDPAALTAELAEGQCADGYPRFSARSAPPNVEHQAHQVLTGADDPLPASWATVPPGLGMRAACIRDIRHPSELTPEVRARLEEEASLVSHPDLRCERLPTGHWATLRGCSSNGDWSFPVPALRVRADYRIGDRQGHLALAPTLVTLLPEEKRFTITYETWFRFRTSVSDERSIRLVIEEN